MTQQASVGARPKARSSGHLSMEKRPLRRKVRAVKPPSFTARFRLIEQTAITGRSRLRDPRNR